jgi:phosphoserine phosphatase
VGNRLAVADGKLTGGLDGPISDSATKRATLLEEQEKLGGKVPTLATGDGANDIPMIEEATYGIAFEAKPKARAAANGWVDRGDLTAVLRLLGIPRRIGCWIKKERGKCEGHRPRAPFNVYVRIGFGHKGSPRRRL